MARGYVRGDKRTGRTYRALRAKFLGRMRAINAPCWLCGEPIDWDRKGRGTRAPELDHAYPASTHPHLVYEPSNFRIAHARCNQRRGARTPEAYRARLQAEVDAINSTLPTPWTPTDW